MILYVYAGWLEDTPLIGKIYQDNNNAQEVYSFEYDQAWLKNCNFYIDPNVYSYEGRQYSNEKTFGFISDCLPDRWGRTLLDRNESIVSKLENRRAKKLNDIDYLLRTNDYLRTGGLRFKLEKDGEFVANSNSYSIPVFTNLKQLEQTSICLEKTSNYDKYLKDLLSPGSSLGGARPKASVMDDNGELWIAKFPSKNDDYDVGAFEKLSYDLAKMCGIKVSESKIIKFSEYGSTFLTKRFDRIKTKRIHFSSAMNLLNKKDGEVASYIEIASFIRENGGNPKDDLKELFKRLVFNMVISNTDDHLRNHGFLLIKNKWELSPAYDLNPVIDKDYLSLNISDNDSYISFDILSDVNKYFSISKIEAETIVENIKRTVKNNWVNIAKKHKIKKEEIEYMKTAFRVD